MPQASPLHNAIDLGGAMKNVNAHYVREAMKEQGWVNPDGHGYLWWHPDIVDSDEKPIPMTAYTAEPLALIMAEDIMAVTEHIMAEKEVQPEEPK